MSVVDVHAHVLLPGLQAAVAERDPAGAAAAQALDALRQGPESLRVSGGMIRERFERLTVLERRLADMDAGGIDVQIVSPSPSHYYPWADAALAEWSAREANRLVAELVGRAPSRLRGLGLIAAQHPELCVELLDDALAQGLAGVEISSTANGVELSDRRLDPFWARAEESRAVLFLHPFGCTLDERIDTHYLSNIVGQPTENAIALSHLIFGGVLDRFPGLRVVAAHGGGYLPTSIGRSDHGWRVRPEARSCENPPSSYLRRLYFDSLTHSPAELRALVAVAGSGRVLLGSDYPFDMGVDDPVGAAREAGLRPDTLDALLGGNASALFALEAVAR
ncbi:aminocarboxymuconate-semialdehyde decarboxylase [Rathayibacter oskolensis]|uniref:Aminocarboxymuconate-semialdehyde decarboxylase n=1 Tax=Rathayibacter oskolensis TaxID=1891671 RepID=A0A1X7NX15_9MICO|nr:amidohydrolase family protein [Rathayibacter oskolensis]SMH42444.1 aminocarboxymuconate-semialdehyde decarboxylase [Rathayibacter oskolensis]